MGATLKSKNFVLKPWKKGDERIIIKYLNNKKIWVHLMNLFPSYPPSLSEVERYINDRLNNEKQKTSFAIIIKGEIVGAIGFRMKNNDVAYMGYWLGEDYWNKGIMTEALKIIVKYAFDEFNLSKLYANVFDWNKSSIKILEKTGFKFSKVSRENLKYEDKLFNELEYIKNK